MPTLIVALAMAASLVASPVHPEPQVVAVKAMNFAFDAPSSVRPGVTTFRLTNTGTQLHHLTVIRLAEGKTVADYAAAMKTGGPPPAWAQDVGGPNAAIPGTTTEATVNLAPGNYALVCFIPSPGEQIPHLMKGMVRPMTVRGRSTGGIMPAGDVSARLDDFSFSLSTPLTAGRHVIHVTNVSKQSHEMVLVRLAPGRTIADFGKWVNDGMQGQPPAMPLGGMAALSTGQSGSFPVLLTPGSYGMVCFVLDLHDGKPHLDHGMMQQFEVPAR